MVTGQLRKGLTLLLPPLLLWRVRRSCGSAA